MIVSPCSETRRVLSALLTAGGHGVQEADGGQDLLKRLDGQIIDVFLVEAEMTGISGIELTRRLRTMPQFSSTPILLLTPEGQAEGKLAGREAGATGWMSRPVRVGQVEAVMRRLAG